MTTEETVSRSPLDKPLQLLTEEDISQLTREDCRRYLKEKGMRRPSWNKSQAIQQVISLKRLLETTSDSDAGACKKLYAPRPHNPPCAPKSTSGDALVSVPAEATVPCGPNDLEKSSGSGEMLRHLVVSGNDSVPPRNAGVTNSQQGQLTIFYCGKVNVYDNVPAEKVQTIMELAASQCKMPPDIPIDGNMGSHLHSANSKEIPDSPLPVIQTTQVVSMKENSRLQSEDDGVAREDHHASESMSSRKALVQRYLEKRKDRFKSKAKVMVPSSSSLDMYANHAVGNQAPDELSNRSDSCSSPPIRPPNTPTRCSHLNGE